MDGVLSVMSLRLRTSSHASHNKLINGTSCSLSFCCSWGNCLYDQAGGVNIFDSEGGTQPCWTSSMAVLGLQMAIPAGIERVIADSPSMLEAL